MSHKEWSIIANKINDNYADFDGSSPAPTSTTARLGALDLVRVWVAGS